MIPVTKGPLPARILVWGSAFAVVCLLASAALRLSAGTSTGASGLMMFAGAGFAIGGHLVAHRAAGIRSGTRFDLAAMVGNVKAAEQALGWTPPGALKPGGSTWAWLAGMFIMLFLALVSIWAAPAGGTSRLMDLWAIGIAAVIAGFSVTLRPWLLWAAERSPSPNPRR